MKPPVTESHYPRPLIGSRVLFEPFEKWPWPVTMTLTWELLRDFLQSTWPAKQKHIYAIVFNLSRGHIHTHTHTHTPLPNNSHNACVHDNSMTIWSNLRNNKGFRQTHSAANNASLQHRRQYWIMFRATVRRNLFSMSYVNCWTTVALLNVRSKEDIEFCMQMFNCPSVDLTVAKLKVKFLTKYCHSENSWCFVFKNRARSELDKISLNATSY